MHALHKITFMAALALCAFPDTVPAGEAAATSAAAQRDSEKKLAEAQQRLDTAAREVAELSSQMGRRFNFRLGTEPGGGPPPRALLGVNVDVNSSRDGARVMDVSPGGAAAEAGIKPGDIITGIADLDLTKDSNPSRALVEKMNQLAPDQKVKVAVLRDGKKLSFDVAPRPAPQDVFIRRQEMQGGGRGPGNGRGETREFNFGNRTGAAGPSGPGGPGGPGGVPGGRGPGADGAPRFNAEVIERSRADLQRGLERMQVLPELFRGDDSEARFGGAELASLSERLGSYFGVKAGVLVVRAGVDSPFKLQDGDVILAVDGRDITSAQQAGRILRSYQPGEKLTLKVQRDRKVQNLEITAPGGRKPN
jgi:predicted metalloprotease with PDZ domain